NGREVEHFRLARQLDPERYAPAPQLGRKEFERCIQEAIRELPAGVTRALEGIGMVVQELPHPDDLSESSARVSPRCLGLLVSTNGSRSGPSSTTEEIEPVIVLFKRNLERATTSRDHLVAEIKLTILHEIGHALGLEEHESLR
ncbi:MAG: metallopeptidase family protein, partial [Myxococcota bacterium]